MSKTAVFSAILLYIITEFYKTFDLTSGNT